MAVLLIEKWAYWLLVLGLFVGAVATFAETWVKRRESAAIKENEELRNTLTALLTGDVGRQTLAKLATGQATDTDDGRAWLRAAAMVTPN